jgi:hypothetical protein
MAAQRLVTYLALVDFVSALLAKNALAINAGRSQAILVCQVAVVAKIGALAG